MEFTSPLTAILVIAFVVLAFLALREVICWYYKINKMVDQQAKQIELLQQIINKLNEKKSEI